MILLIAATSVSAYVTYVAGCHYLEIVYGITQVSVTVVEIGLEAFNESAARVIIGIEIYNPSKVSFALRMVSFRLLLNGKLVAIRSVDYFASPIPIAPGSVLVHKVEVVLVRDELSPIFEASGSQRWNWHAAGAVILRNPLETTTTINFSSS